MKKIFVTLLLFVASFALFGQNNVPTAVTCNKCNGSGSIRENKTEPCSKCNGAKTVIVYETQTCPQCNGTTIMKVVKNGELVDAPCNYSLCNNGKIKVPKTEKCGSCGGTGTKSNSVTKTCPKCNGTGTITQ